MFLWKDLNQVYSDDEIIKERRKRKLDDCELPGYDGLAFLFNDSNEDAIMGKIDENTLEEESKLPLASDNKVNFNVIICVHTIYLVGILSFQ